MKKPREVVYGVAEAPPAGVTVLSALQHVALMSINLIYPVLIGREAGGSSQDVANLVALALLVMGAGSVLQALPRGPIGSGFLCPPVPTAIYLVPSMLAARRGGLPLVLGMTMFAGLLEMGLSRVLRHLRPLLPPEIAGLVVMLIGLTTATVGVRALVGEGLPVGSGLSHGVAAALTLATMIAFSVWTRGALRLFCVLIGMAAGYAVTMALGGFHAAAMDSLARTPLLALPRFGHGGWDFDPTLAVAFTATAVAASLKVVGNVTTCQRINDADWVRADMPSISRGVLADGLTTTLAGALGATGVNSATMCVGLSSATGVLSRRVSFVAAGLLALLTLFPKVGVALYVMPAAVAGAALIFAASFIFVSGLEIVTSRLLDMRRTLVVGLGFAAGFAGEVHGTLLKSLPGSAGAFLGNPLVLGTVVALLLNLAFRVGVRQTETLSIALDRVDSTVIHAFLEDRGATWGARRDVIDRASFNLAQSVEAIVDGCEPLSPLEIAASFDEFRLDVRISWAGAPLPLPTTRPTNVEIMESDEGQRKLAGFLVRRLADRVQSTHTSGRAVVSFSFDH